VLVTAAASLSLSAGDKRSFGDLEDDDDDAFASKKVR
jgi:hypothetical protein